VSAPKMPTFEELIAARVRAELAAVDLGDPWVSQDESPLGRKLHCRLVRTGKLEGSKIGRRVLVRRSVLDRFIESHKVSPAASSTSEFVDSLFRGDPIKASIRALDIRPRAKRGSTVELEQRDRVDALIIQTGTFPEKINEDRLRDGLKPLPVPTAAEVDAYFDNRRKPRA